MLYKEAKMIQRLAKFMEKVTGFFLEDHYNNQINNQAKTNHSFYNDLYDASVMAIVTSGMC
jgi:hypothetical protein